MNWLTSSPYLSLLLSLLAAGVFLTTFLIKANHLNRHFFFLCLQLTALIYLFLAPAGSLFLMDLPEQAYYAADYVQVQFYLILFFQIPFVGFYLLVYRWPKPKPLLIRLSRWRASFLAIGSILAALLFLGMLVRNNLLFSRIGSEYIAQAIVQLPKFDFVIIRSFQESALLLIGILFFSYVFAKGTQRSFILLALLVTLTSWGIFTILNSRLYVILTVVCLMGWWLLLQSKPFARRRQITGVLLLGILGLYSVSVVINVRNTGFQGQILPEYFVPHFNWLGDSQGVNRLNCVDLMARMNPELHLQGPALGEAWSNVYWLFYRFIDPVGFDNFRLSLSTTAKSYLMQRYLNWDIPDYYSCVLTDFYGNYFVFGFLVAALLLAVLLVFQHRAMLGYFGGAGVVLGIFIATRILYFDQEGASLLFGWVRQLPILLMAIILSPFRVKS